MRRSFDMVYEEPQVDIAKLALLADISIQDVSTVEVQ
jgi:hypothetical protein